MTENASEPLTAANKTTVIMEKEHGNSEKKSAAAPGPGLIPISAFYVKHFILQQLDLHPEGSLVSLGARRASWEAAPSQRQKKNQSCHLNPRMLKNTRRLSMTLTTTRMATFQPRN